MECKRSDSPSLTPSMRIALADLRLDRLHVVHPGDRRYALAKYIDVMPLGDLAGKA